MWCFGGHHVCVLRFRDRLAWRMLPPLATNNAAHGDAMYKGEKRGEKSSSHTHTLFLFLFFSSSFVCSKPPNALKKKKKKTSKNKGPLIANCKTQEHQERGKKKAADDARVLERVARRSCTACTKTSTVASFPSSYGVLLFVALNVRNGANTYTT